MSAPYYEDARVTILAGDCLDVLATLPDASVDSVVTDPPYGLEFMGKEWDAPWKQGADVHAEARTLRADEMGDENKRRYIASAVNKFSAGLPFQQWCELWTAECLRVLKPGGHLLAFGGTRTWHRLACAVEDAGFEVRDSIAWMYGSGFPKSLDVSKAIDKAAGAEREPDDYTGANHLNAVYGQGMGGGVTLRRAEGATDAARTWQGWGTALKPAFEPVVVARKPLVGTVAGNVLAHGTGALNVDGCRIEATDSQLAEKYASVQNAGARANSIYGTDDRDRAGAAPHAAGRWPANVVLDESQAAELDQQSGEVGGATRGDDGGAPGRTAMSGGTMEGRAGGHGDSGGASRFFYVAKADAGERVRVNGTAHPTVKPLTLMRWLVRLVTPPGGTVLEPFAGSGTTVEACILEGFKCIAIEREADYLPLIMQRINRRVDPVAAVLAAGDDAGLFDLLGEEPA